MKTSFLSNNTPNRYSVRMTPLIDIIFLLMIFFLFTINFEKPEGAIENQLPRLGERDSTETGKDWEIVRLRVKLIRENKQLKIYLQERVLFSYSDLLLYLNQLPNDILIVIEPDEKVPYKHVIGVYNICLKSNKKDIVFSITG